MDNKPASNARWVYDNPVYSDVEAKLRRFLVELGNDDKILGIQVCAYKDGQVIIDTAAGVLGKHDPRPIQPDSLFPVFSVTKGVTAGIVHWLADKGKLKLDENVANIWPEFGINGKDQIKINHILNHTSGLANIGIPSGAESRIVTVKIDRDDLRQLDPKGYPEGTNMPSSFTLDLISNFIALVNMPEVHCAIQPAGGGYFSARALARYYATLVDGGVVPPPHPSSSLPPLGSHPHHPTSLPTETSVTPKDKLETKIFNNTKVKLHDAFLGSGDNKNLVLPNGMFGLGFNRFQTPDGSVIGFGHSGLGGATAYCDINNRFSISVTLNKLSLGALTGEIIRFACSELQLPVPLDYTKPSTDKKPIIN